MAKNDDTVPETVIHFNSESKPERTKMINLTPGRMKNHQDTDSIETKENVVQVDVSSRRKQLQAITLMDRYIDEERIPISVQNEHRSLKLLLEYLDQCTFRRIQHELSETHFRCMDRLIEIPNLIFAASNFTIATSSKSSIDGSITYPYSLVITVFAGITMLSTSISTYLDIKKKVNDHCLAKNLWRDIESDILFFLSQNVVTVSEINIFTAQMHERIDSQANSSPPVPGRPAQKAYHQMLSMYKDRQTSIQ